jgi:hypothetical protein
VGTGTAMAPVQATALVVVALLGAACASTQEVRSERPVPTTSAPTASTAPTTTIPSAVPTTGTTGVGTVVPVVGWSHPATTLPPAGGFTAASCISDVFCLAAGGGANEADASLSTGPGVVSSWDGATWAPSVTYFAAPADGPATAPELPAIACTHGPRCAVVDGSGHTALGDGTTWSPLLALAPSLVAVADPADSGPGHPGSRSAAVACPTSQFCAYVDNTGHVATLQGTTWSAPQAITARTGSSAVELFQSGRVGISCATASTCTALVGGTVLDWNGTGWTAGPGPWPDGTAGDSAVSCPTPGTCLAVRGSSLSARTPGTGWSAPRVIDGNGGLDTLSCPTTSFCMAADAYGNVVHLAGGTWSAPSKVVPTPVDYAGDGTSVSCPTDQFCLVLNGDGDYATYQGATPSDVPVTNAPPVGT